MINLVDYIPADFGPWPQSEWASGESRLHDVCIVEPATSCATTQHVRTVDKDVHTVDGDDADEQKTSQASLCGIKGGITELLILSKCYHQSAF